MRSLLLVRESGPASLISFVAQGRLKFPGLVGCGSCRRHAAREVPNGDSIETTIVAEEQEPIRIVGAMADDVEEVRHRATLGNCLMKNPKFGGS
jgi:hypothetical protein